MAKPPLRDGLHGGDSAIAWFRNRVPTADDETRDAESAMAQRSFWVAGVTQMRLVTDVMQALDDAIANGTTLEDFRAEVEDKLRAAWGEEEPWRLENIFRTNLQSAYSAARTLEMRDPVVANRRPYWRFDAIVDENTSPICEGLDGTILAADDPFWGDHTPPLHHQCRSTLTSIEAEDIEPAEVGLDDTPLPEVAEGFGEMAHPDDFDQDLSGYPHELVAVFQGKLSDVGE